MRHKAVQEIRRLRRQLAGEVRQVIPGDTHHLDTELQHLSPPDQVQARLLQQLLLAGSPWQVARRISEQEEKEAKENRGGYRTGAMEQLGEFIDIDGLCFIFQVQISQLIWLKYIIIILAFIFGFVYLLKIQKIHFMVLKSE